MAAGEAGWQFTLVANKNPRPEERDGRAEPNEAGKPSTIWWLWLSIVLAAHVEKVKISS
jgi:hypothetical protein